MRCWHYFVSARLLDAWVDDLLSGRVAHPERPGPTAAARVDVRRTCRPGDRDRLPLDVSPYSVRAWWEDAA